MRDDDNQAASHAQILRSDIKVSDESSIKTNTQLTASSSESESLDNGKDDEDTSTKEIVAADPPRVVDGGTPCRQIQFADNKMKFCVAPGALKHTFFTKSGVEHDIGVCFDSIIRDHRKQDTDRAPLIVDVGMNEGFFTILPAVMGAKVMSFDLQPACFKDVGRMLIQNNVSRSVRLRNVGLWNEKGILDLSSSDTCSPFNSISSKKNTAMAVGLSTLDDELVPFFDEYSPDLKSLTLLKVDAEGAEIQIIEGVMEALRNSVVKRFILELSPQWWERINVSSERGIQVITNLLSSAKMTPYVFPNDDEKLDVGLDTQSMERCGVAGMRKLTDVKSFVLDRIQKRKGCNLYLIPEQSKSMSV